MKTQHFMNQALEEAKKAYEMNEVPIGCVIVKDDKIIARAYNQKEMKQDPLSHAEIEAIHQAIKAIGSRYLLDCDLYVTLEPCMMCTGAIIHSRIHKVFYAAKDPKGGAFESNIQLNNIQGLNHYPEYEGGICEETASQLLKEFFKEKRQNKKKETIHEEG